MCLWHKKITVQVGQGSKVDDEMIVFSSQELCTQVVKQLGINRSYLEDKGWYKPQKDHYNSSPIEVIAPEEMFDTLSSVKFKIDVDKRLLPLIDEFKPATWREAIK